MQVRLLFGGLLFVGALATPGPAGTYATSATTVASQGNRFSAGTLHIAESLAAGATLSIDNLLAGDNFDAQLDVTNSGSLSLLYSVTSATSGDAGLASTLQLTVRAKTSQPCAARDGSVLYAGSLSSAAIGDPTHGAQPGDRTLSNGATESLCFTVELPSTATSTVAGRSVSATFTFNAEQS